MEPALIVYGMQAGHQDAAESLYAVLSAAPRRYLLRHMGYRDNQDRVHDLYVTITRAIMEGRVLNPDALHGYIWATMRMQAVADIRRAIRQRDAQMPVPTVDERPSAEAVLLSEERASAVRRMMRRLGKRDREVLDRFYLRDESPKLIQRKMGVAATVYRVMKSRALGRLKVLNTP